MNGPRRDSEHIGDWESVNPTEAGPRPFPRQADALASRPEAPRRAGGQRPRPSPVHPTEQETDHD